MPTYLFFLYNYCPSHLHFILQCREKNVICKWLKRKIRVAEDASNSTTFSRSPCAGIQRWKLWNCRGSEQFHSKSNYFRSPSHLFSRLKGGIWSIQISIQTALHREAWDYFRWALIRKRVTELDFSSRKAVSRIQSENDWHNNGNDSIWALKRAPTKHVWKASFLGNFSTHAVASSIIFILTIETLTT